MPLRSRKGCRRWVRSIFRLSLTSSTFTLWQKVWIRVFYGDRLVWLLLSFEKWTENIKMSRSFVLWQQRPQLLEARILSSSLLRSWEQTISFIVSTCHLKLLCLWAAMKRQLTKMTEKPWKLGFWSILERGWQSEGNQEVSGFDWRVSRIFASIAQLHQMGLFRNEKKKFRV